MSFVSRLLSVIRPHLFVYTLVVTFLPQSSSNFVRMFVEVIALMSSNTGHRGCKTRSQELKIEKYCLHSSGYCFDPNILEIALKVCIDDFSNDFEHGSTWMKN
jgi:hypothetical protein